MSAPILVGSSRSGVYFICNLLLIPTPDRFIRLIVVGSFFLLCIYLIIIGPHDVSIFSIGIFVGGIFLSSVFLSDRQENAIEKIRLIIQAFFWLPCLAGLFFFHDSFFNRPNKAKPKDRPISLQALTDERLFYFCYFIPLNRSSVETLSCVITSAA